MWMVRTRCHSPSIRNEKLRSYEVHVKNAIDGGIARIVVSRICRLVRESTFHDEEQIRYEVLKAIDY